MFTEEELGNIERSLDDAGVSPGLYRDGYLACMRDILEGFKSKAFEEMVQQEFIQALVKVWAEAMIRNHFESVKQAFGKRS